MAVEELAADAFAQVERARREGRKSRKDFRAITLASDYVINMRFGKPQLSRSGTDGVPLIY